MPWIIINENSVHSSEMVGNDIDTHDKLCDLLCHCVLKWPIEHSVYFTLILSS